MPFIVSSLANSQLITDYSKPESEGKKVARPATPERQVLIKGGAHVMGAIHTPEGVITKITDDELEFLKGNKQFQRLEKRGHFKVTSREVNPDKVASDLRLDNGDVKNGERVSGGSAPLSIANGDFDDGGRAAGIAPVETSAI